MINKNIIVNADDLGMTPGTNQAIFCGYDNGYINSSSIMTNCDYFDDAVYELQKRKKLNIGIHLNLTYGKALNKSSTYNDDNGIFNLNYLQLLKKSVFDKIFLKEVKKEFELQIQKAIQNNINIKHLDSHRHIHLIPSLYKIVFDLSNKYNIQRVRLIKENFFYSIKITNNFNFIKNGGIIKYFLLKCFTYIDIIYGDKYQDINFYSILYTGILNKQTIHSVLNKYEKFEIMIHPSKTTLDEDIYFYDKAEKEYRLSMNRELELKIIMKNHSETN